MYGTSSQYWNSSASQIGFKTVREDTNATLSTSQGLANYSGITSHFSFESYDNVIYGKPTDNNSGYSVSTSDGAGNTAMYHVRDEIQDFSKLPFNSKTGVIIKITGEEGDTLSDYFVNYTGDGTTDTNKRKNCGGTGVSTHHTWAVALSASPLSIGSKEQYGLYVSLEYL